MNKLYYTSLVYLILFCLLPATAQASKFTSASKFSQVIAKSTSNTLKNDELLALGERALKLQAKHGEEASKLMIKAGPSAVRALERAGDKAPEIIRLYNKMGKGALSLAENKRGLTLIMDLGDDVAPVIAKHSDKATDLITVYGRRAIEPLKQVNRQDAVKLALLHKDKVLTTDPDRIKLLDICGKYGKRGVDFIYDNKGKLLVAATLATFVADPEPYINGAKELASTAITQAVAPVALEASKKIKWNLWIGVSIAALAGFFFYKSRKNKTSQSNA